MKINLGCSIKLHAMNNYMMHVPKHEFAGSSLCWIPISGQYIQLRCCGGLSMVLLQLNKPLALFMMRMEFLPNSGILSHRDMT